MTTRLEDDLRAALAGATPPPGLSLDPEAVLRRGKRTVHARRVVRAGAVAVAVAAIAVAMSAGLLTGGHRLSSGPADGTTTARPPVVARLTLGDHRYAVTVGFDPGNVSRLDFSRVDASGRTFQLGTAAVAHGVVDNGPTFAHADPSGAILGVLPSDTVSVTAYYLGHPLSASSVTTAPLPGTGYEAVGILPETPDLASQFEGVGWADHRGVWSTTVGSSDTVATFTLPRSGNQVSVWTDLQHPNWGAYLTGGTSSADAAPALGARETAWTGEGSPETAWSCSYGLLPEGVTNVQYGLADGEKALGPVQTQPLPGVHLTAFVLELQPPRATMGHRLRSLTWTNPDGSTGHHTFS